LTTDNNNRSTPAEGEGAVTARSAIARTKHGMHHTLNTTRHLPHSVSSYVSQLSRQWKWHLPYPISHSPRHSVDSGIILLKRPETF
ncbi:hypothetical protein BaRGS_00001922, partial [Batillaria attramentaria]